MRSTRCLRPLAALLAAPALGWASSGEALEEVVVTGTLRSQSWLEAPASITVLDATTLKEAGQQHFQDVLDLTPNLNWAAGTSRPRYFQIRGIGEREQYEGAPNPSVGFLIDDIDFSGLGMPATLFDVGQIEVLRGPQGTRYGANALAGLIVVRGNDPQLDPHWSIEATGGEYGTRAAGLTATGPAESLKSAWRLAVQQYRSDGFMRNTHLRRDDTNDRDELTARFKWRWQPREDTTLDFTVLHADIDNGYDAWAIDNSRTTLSDRPGKDAQRATGVSARLVTSAWGPYTFTIIGSHADSESINSFDADWGNANSWAPYTYDYFSRSDRDRRTSSLELRLATPDAAPGTAPAWLVGVYALRLEEDGRDLLLGEFADPDFPEWDSVTEDTLASTYEATNLAAFGQLDGYLTNRLRWSAGVRYERRRADYADQGLQDGAPVQHDLSARDHMIGGQLSLSASLSETSTVYASVSRGYKAGGFNLGNISPDKRRFDPEYLWNLETGFKSRLAGGRALLDVALFYQWRRDLQIRTGQQADPTNPGTYIFITDNIARGYNTGIEASLRYAVTPSLELGGSIGLLRSRLSGALNEDGEPVPPREQAHAPEYTAAVHAAWRHPRGFMARVDVTAKDNFYFDVPTDHDMQSHAYSIVNLKVGYEQPRWSAHLWVRNLFDEDYAVRGFFFSNEPPDWAEKLYVQRGDPRQVGLTVNVSF